jgi:hypothetical protein
MLTDFDSRTVFNSIHTAFLQMHFFFTIAPFSSSSSGWPDSDLESTNLGHGTQDNPLGPLGSHNFVQKGTKKIKFAFT